MNCGCIPFNYPLLLLLHLCRLPCSSPADSAPILVCRCFAGSCGFPLLVIAVAWGSLETGFHLLLCLLWPSQSSHPIFHDSLDFLMDDIDVFFRIECSITTYSQSAVWPVVSLCSSRHPLLHKNETRSAFVHGYKHSVQEALWLHVWLSIHRWYTPSPGGTVTSPVTGFWPDLQLTVTHYLPWRRSQI